MAERNDRLRERSARAEQRDRYENLANWAWGVLSNNGKDRPGLQTEAMLREQMVNRRMLTRDGDMRVDRMEKFMAEKAHVRSKKTPNLPISDEGWESILEGGSPKYAE